MIKILTFNTNDEEKYLKNRAVIPKMHGKAGAAIAKNAIPNP